MTLNDRPPLPPEGIPSTTHGDTTNVIIKTGTQLLFQTTFCEDPVLNSSIEHLHALARQGGCAGIQPYIDAYLPAVAYLKHNNLSHSPTQISQKCAQRDPHRQQHQNLARKMVLSPTDAPQLGTLPDLTHILRRMLLQTELDQCGFVLTPLYSALPCIRRPAARKMSQACRPTPQKTAQKTSAHSSAHSVHSSQSESGASQSPQSSQSSPTPRAIKPQITQTPQLPQDTHQVAICILLGLLLGLYPTSVKFPPFQVRVALYRRVHALLTSGGGATFCQAHPALLTMAMMEYCAYVIPAYLPVEHALLAEETGMQTFFAAFPLACDTFRQEALETGEEPWSALESHCAPLVEKHSRACKSRQRAKQALDQFPVVKLPASAVDRLAEIPYVVPYSVHLDDPTHCIMASEMAFLGISTLSSSSDNSKDSTKESEIKHEQAVALQRTIHAHQLPPNLAQLQLGALSDRMRICERSALSCTVLYVCVSCVMANQQTICRKGRAFPTRGQCKYDFGSETHTSSLLCSVCQSHSIISISTLGRIVSLRNYRFYLAPCCATVQMYTGRGDEFQLTAQSTPATCPHARQSRGAQKQAKKRCELCANVALPEAHCSVDHLSGQPHCTYLCQRHTPHPDSLKHVTNWRQLQEEIRRRDRPLFALRYTGRRSEPGD